MLKVIDCRLSGEGKISGTCGRAWWWHWIVSDGAEGIRRGFAAVEIKGLLSQDHKPSWRRSNKELFQWLSKRVCELGLGTISLSFRLQICKMG